MQLFKLKVVNKRTPAKTSIAIYPCTAEDSLQCGLHTVDDSLETRICALKR